MKVTVRASDCTVDGKIMPKWIGKKPPGRPAPRIWSGEAWIGLFHSAEPMVMRPGVDKPVIQHKMSFRTKQPCYANELSSQVIQKFWKESREEFLDLVDEYHYIDYGLTASAR